MKFLTEKNKDSMLFPRPDDGAVVQISPPGLAWLPAEGASGYRVEIRNGVGSLVYEKTIGSDPVHLPDQVLEAGNYKWDVAALDENGNDAARRGGISFSIAENAPELPWVEPDVLLSRVPEGHSRLLYLKRDLPAIRQTLQTTRKQSWNAILRAAEKALEMSAPEYPKYHLNEDRQRVRMEYMYYFQYVRQYIDRALMHLSLAFLMTEDKKYADAGKRILMEIASWPTNDDDVTSVSAKWGDEAGLSMSRCAHRAYDWLYAALSDEEKAKVLKMCEERAWQTYRRLKNRLNMLTYPGSSHDGRLIAYISEMAIVMAGESEGAKTWLDYSLKGLTTFYPHWGGYEGGWAEGIGYGLAYNRIYLPAFEGLRTAMDFNLWKRPFFRNVRYFFFYCAAIRGEMKPFGDGAERGGPGMSPEGYASLLWHHAHTFKDPHMYWWAKQLKGWEGSSDELSLMFEDEMESKPPTDLPNSRAFRGIGWAALHSDMSKPDEDTFLLFKSSPYGSVSHSHADQNSFCIMKGGHGLAIASGYYGPSYGMPHHSEWTRSTKANNCVLVNGEGQTIRKANANGRILDFEDGKGLSYVAGGAAAAYMGKMRRFNRHILFLRPGLFLLLDDLEAPEPSIFQWMLHAYEKMELDSEMKRVVSTRENARLEVYLQSPSGITLSQTDQFDTPFNEGIPEDFHKDVANQWHVTAQTERESEAVRIGAIMSVSAENESFDLEVLSHEGWFGARAKGSFGSAEGWVQVQVGATGPERYGEDVAKGIAIMCGISSDGQKLVI